MCVFYVSVKFELAGLFSKTMERNMFDSFSRLLLYECLFYLIIDSIGGLRTLSLFPFLFVVPEL